MSLVRHVRSRANLLLLLCAAAAALALAALGFTLVYRVTVSEQFRVRTAENCMQLERLKAGISLVFSDTLDALEEQRPYLDAAYYERLSAFYRRQLIRFAPTDCPSP